MKLSIRYGYTNSDGVSIHRGSVIEVSEEEGKRRIAEGRAMEIKDPEPQPDSKPKRKTRTKVQDEV